MHNLFILSFHPSIICVLSVCGSFCHLLSICLSSLSFLLFFVFSWFLGRISQCNSNAKDCVQKLSISMAILAFLSHNSIKKLSYRWMDKDDVVYVYICVCFIYIYVYIYIHMWYVYIFMYMCINIYLCLCMCVWVCVWVVAWWATVHRVTKSQRRLSNWAHMHCISIYMYTRIIASVLAKVT